MPAMFVTGRNDDILPPNFTSRAYFGLNNVVDGSISQLRYYEVTNAQHLDAFNAFPRLQRDKYIPLHRYFIQAMDLMYAHLRNGAALPPSQVVHTMPRGPGAPADHVRKRAADRSRAGARTRHHLQRRAGEHPELANGRTRRIPARAARLGLIRELSPSQFRQAPCMYTVHGSSAPTHLPRFAAEGHLSGEGLSRTRRGFAGLPEVKPWPPPRFTTSPR